MTGLIFNVQKFSIHDGPGIRTTVFMKGCNLRCAWCHNPESFLMVPQLETTFEKCIGCGKCFQVCPNGCHEMTENGRVFHRDRCIGCGKCADVCYTDALTITGKSKTPDEVLKEILADKDFYVTSGGGATFSGGEPLLQSDFLLECLKLCKENNIHTAIDTAGNVDFSVFEKLNPYVDLYLFDVKTMDSEKHHKYTSVHNERILENLKKLTAIAKEIWIRTPVIPDVNDDEESIRAITDFLKSLNATCITRYELNPFHRLGSAKYRSLDMEYAYAQTKSMAKEKINALREIAKL